MQLYKEGVYNAVDKSNGEERTGVYYLYFLSSQSYILPIAFFFHLIHSSGFHWNALNKILTDTYCFKANFKTLIDFDVSII